MKRTFTLENQLPMDLLGMKTFHNLEDMHLAVVEALDRKRIDIAREIAEFRAMKDKEFIAFEQQLRAAEKKLVDQEHSQKKKEPEQTGTRTLEKPEGVLDQGQDSIAVVEAGLDTRGARHLADGSNQVHQPKDLPNGTAASGTQQAKWPTSLGAAESHEREVEFHGLFIPSYLPLLDGSTRKQKDWPGKPILKLSMLPQGRRTSLRNSATVSSPASFPPSTIFSSKSPPKSRQFSTSAPREQASRQGRRSSSSDLSPTRLRSSLRNPTQPRSPKRVLFSINNLVVSPSTSPEVEKRSTPVSKFQLPGIDNVPRGAEIVVAGKSKEPQLGGGSWDAGSAIGSATNRSTVPALAVRNPIVYTSGPYQNPSDIIKSRPRKGAGDEFVSVGLDDDLFTFDEDLNLDLDLDEFKSIEEIPEGSAGSEEDEGGSKDVDPTAASSPHAGSLPIEIKWPATTTRRDRGK